MREMTLDKLPKNVIAKLDLETAFIASRCVVAAERLLIFRKLYKSELTIPAIRRRTGIRGRQLESLLECLVFLGLLKKRGSAYRNSRLAEKHFICARSIEWTRFWSSECAQDYEALTALEDVLLTGSDWRDIVGKVRQPDYVLARDDPQWAEQFTYALFDRYKSDAELLARHLDLSAFSNLLDVGGGSGVMSMALARKHPRLKACVLDFQYVCDAARTIIRKERMSGKVTTLVGDMNVSIPSGYDVIMFWNIGRIETRVMEMAYRSMPEGGMIIRSCPQPSISKVTTPAKFLHQYVSVRPEGQSRDSIEQSLRAAGFKGVEYHSIEGQLYMLVAHKKGQVS